MSKQDYIMQGRNEGIAFCDKIAKEKGLEELQRVTRQRNLAGLRTLIDPRELDQDFRDATLQILDTVLIMSLIVLKDEFDCLYKDDGITPNYVIYQENMLCLTSINALYEILRSKIEDDYYELERDIDGLLNMWSD